MSWCFGFFWKINLPLLPLLLWRLRRFFSFSFPIFSHVDCRQPVVVSLVVFSFLLLTVDCDCGCWPLAVDWGCDCDCDQHRVQAMGQLDDRTEEARKWRERHAQAKDELTVGE